MALSPARKIFPLPVRNNPEAHRRELADAISRLQQGKIGSVGSVTLTAISATTTLTDANIGPDSAIILVPTTENASKEFVGLLDLDSVGIYPSARVNGSATLTHSNHSSSDRTFTYVVLG